MIKNPDFTDISDINPQKAWIIFTNQTELPCLGIFKEGFRHCFVLIHDGQHWISIDPMANYMEVVVHNVPVDFDLPVWLRERGHHVIEAQLTKNIKRSAPIMLFTCVEACKRILGIHKLSILTPWQLYRYLELQQNFFTHKGDFKMGSLSSTPKIPQRQVIKVPVALTSQEPTQSIITAGQRAEQESKEREQSLLSRGRGRFGTIATSFQGFLREIDQKNIRKTLLGE